MHVERKCISHNRQVILDSIYDINTIWESIKQPALIKSWMKILPNVENTLVESSEKEELSPYYLTNLAKSITGGKGNVDEDNIIEWFDCDANDPGFEHFTHKQIVDKVLEKTEAGINSRQDFVGECTVKKPL